MIKLGRQSLILASLAFSASLLPIRGSESLIVGETETLHQTDNYDLKVKIETDQGSVLDKVNNNDMILGFFHKYVKLLLRPIIYFLNFRDIKPTTNTKAMMKGLRKVLFWIMVNRFIT